MAYLSDNSIILWVARHGLPTCSRRRTPQRQLSARLHKLRIEDRDRDKSGWAWRRGAGIVWVADP